MDTIVIITLCVVAGLVLFIKPLRMILKGFRMVIFLAVIALIIFFVYSNGIGY